jgi:ferritin-like metal-binding protein YciE
MSPTALDTFVVGLRDAHAMELQARDILERQAGRLDDYPEVKARIVQHLAETNQQIGRLDECLAACGESSSPSKDTARSMMANTMDIACTMASDEIFKNMFANNALENFEIAAYRLLVCLCDAVGHSDCRPMLEQSLAEEERMAGWIASNIEQVTARYLAKQSVLMANFA